MAKIWLLIVAGIMLLSFVIAGNASQNVTVTVVPGIMNVFSPIDNYVYQINQVPVNVTVDIGAINVTNLWIMEGKDKSLLCSKCKNYFGYKYFADASHSIIIKADFANKESIQQTINFEVDSSSYIYIIKNGVLKRATIQDIVDYLFNYDFTLVHKNELAPEDSCSVRASNGNASVNSTNFGNKNSVNFYYVSNIEQGQVELSMQNGRRYLSYKYKIINITENSQVNLRVIALDKNNKQASIKLDKNNKKVSVNGSDFSIDNMGVTFLSGCSEQKKSFWFLQNNGNLNRNIDEVRKILNENPIFLKNYSSLSFLFSRFWNLKMLFSGY